MKAHYMPPRRWSTLKKSILILSVSIFTFFIYYMMDSTTPFAFAARRCKYFSLSELIYYTWFYFWPPTKITEALCWFFNPRPQLLVVVAQASQGQIDPINGAYSYILVGDALYNNLPAFWLSRQFKGLSRLRVYNPHLVEAAHLIRKRFFSSFYTPKVLP